MGTIQTLIGNGADASLGFGVTPVALLGLWGGDEALGTGLARMAWNQLWQVTVMVLIVALASRYLLVRHPYLARGLWLLVLVKCLTPPVVGSPLGLFSWSQVQTRDVAILQNDSLAATLERQFEGIAGAGLAGTMVAIWLTGAAVYLAVVFVRIWRLRQVMLRATVPVPAMVERVADEIAQKLRLPGARVRVVDEPFGPAVMGLRRPVVILPTAVVEGKSEDELRPILAHELLHVARGDTLVAALQVIVQAIWWFHPVVWLASRAVSLYCELCCDREVLRLLSCTPKAYAGCLLGVLESRCRLQPIVALPGMRVSEMTLRRLTTLTQIRHGRSRGGHMGLTALVMTSAALVFLPGAALTISPETFTPLFQPDPDICSRADCSVDDGLTEDDDLASDAADVGATVHASSVQASSDLSPAALPVGADVSAGP